MKTTQYQLIVEETLVQELKSKSTQAQAFEVLVSTYKERLYWQIRGIVLNHADAVAASIAVLVLVLISLNWNKANEINFSDLANTDIEAYFENIELDLSPYEIAEVIPVTNTELSDILNSPIENENILNYLNENVNDFEDLNLQDDE